MDPGQQGLFSPPGVGSNGLRTPSAEQPAPGVGCRRQTGGTATRRSLWRRGPATLGSTGTLVLSVPVRVGWLGSSSVADSTSGLWGAKVVPARHRKR